jgi:hypothetical protein
MELMMMDQIATNLGMLEVVTSHHCLREPSALRRIQIGIGAFLTLVASQLSKGVTGVHASIALNLLRKFSMKWLVSYASLKTKYLLLGSAMGR